VGPALSTWVLDDEMVAAKPYCSPAPLAWMIDNENQFGGNRLDYHPFHLTPLSQFLPAQHHLQQK
jgi:hypothetical protein